MSAPETPPASEAAACLPIAGAPCERSDAAANRSRILAAAREVLARQGAAGLSMNAVAAAAGVGKGTIFRRFGDRDGLTAALLDAHAAALQDGFLAGPPPLGPGAEAPERLEAFMRALVAFHAEHLDVVLAAQSVEAHGPPVYGAFLLHIRTLLSQIDPVLDTLVLGELLLGMVAPESLARLLRAGPPVGPLDPERIADGVAAVVHGLVAA